ncbi:MAG TPA: imidazole glycerol phosphate synthase subunit HisH [Bryobacteraceae bacterium]|jgi:imidazole glycerol phosphate synthase glutamine amidotransferase subunit|nr:imidazole glycerol phosphate synthase subunit HisH [Bryobacteraceae bacterium]
MIAILDYGAGNLRSVENALDALGARHERVRSPEALYGAARIILPGVGHFGQLIRSLDSLGLRTPLKRRIEAGAPFLGICLGLQALFEGSEEAPGLPGLALLPGIVRKFGPGARVPHMGWSPVAPCEDTVLFRRTGTQPYFYFAHSFYVPLLGEATAAVCDYTVRYTAAVERGSLFGVQFHPEKSGPLGLRILRNFLEASC